MRTDAEVIRAYKKILAEIIANDRKIAALKAELLTLRKKGVALQRSRIKMENPSHVVKTKQL